MDDIGLRVSPVVQVSGAGLLILSTSAHYGQIHAELRRLVRDAHDGKLAGDSAQVLYRHLHTLSVCTKQMSGWQPDATATDEPHKR